MTKDITNDIMNFFGILSLPQIFQSTQNNCKLGTHLLSQPLCFAPQVELTKCAISVLTLLRVWQVEGVTEDNRLLTSWGELSLYPVPAVLYLAKNMLQVMLRISSRMASRICISQSCKPVDLARGSTGITWLIPGTGTEWSVLQAV